MDKEHFHTGLAYTKSPKTFRRTTFQEELESAVSARASRHKPADSNVYFDDFDDDDDDILNELLKTRKKKIDMFKTGRMKAKINDVQVLDDEEENVQPKKVSFMKTKRKSPSVQDMVVDSGKTDSVGGAESPGSFPSYRGSSTPRSTQDLPTPEKEQQDAPFVSQPNSEASQKNQLESPLGRENQSESVLSRKTLSESSTSRKSLSESPLPLNSENSQSEHLLNLLPEGSRLDGLLPSPLAKGEEILQVDVGGNGESVPQAKERSIREFSLRGLPAENPPRPAPRQRALRAPRSGHDEGDGLAEPPFSKAATTSITPTPSERATTTSVFSDAAWASRSDYVQCEGAQNTVFQKVSMYSSSAIQQGSEASNSSPQSPVDWSGLEQDKTEHCPMPFKEYQEGSLETSHLTASRQSEITINSPNRPSGSRPVSSRKSKSGSYTAESRYLGTLRVLDQKTSLDWTLPNASDSLRAAAYQDWLKKKQEKLQVTMKEKKQEEKLKQDKKAEEENSKKQEAEASYGAWKEKKRMALRGKLQEQQEALRKQRKKVDEETEKKETAKKVFEKWKREHDDLLREKLRKQAQAEARLQEQKEQEQEERKRACNSSFSQWSERKKDSMLEKVRVERRKQTIKEVEAKYEKEEREKMALETYEKWLRRKEFLQKQEKQEKHIKSIIEEEAPPPWSPPGRTIPFRK